jgi:hypothetical protein
MKALRDCLGLVDAEKFIVLIRQEPFDYTEWQKTLWDNQTVDDIFNLAQKYIQEV